MCKTPRLPNVEPLGITTTYDTTTYVLLDSLADEHVSARNMDEGVEG